MRRGFLPKTAREKTRVESSVFFFTAAFVLGCVGGYFSCRAFGASQEIKEYLMEYAKALSAGKAITAASLLGAAAAYFRVPWTVFLCGLSRYAFYLFCCVFFGEGLLLAFAVTTFVLALGRTGVLIALCVFGIRLIFILPVSLSVAVRRCSLAAGQSGRRASRAQAPTGNRRLRSLLVYQVVLTLGVLAEITFVPRLVAFAMQYVS